MQQFDVKADAPPVTDSSNDGTVVNQAGDGTQSAAVADGNGGPSPAARFVRSFVDGDFDFVSIINNFNLYLLLIFLIYTKF